MNARIIQVTALCALPFAFARPAGADATQDARKTIQALYNKENAAISRKDINGATADYAPNFAGDDGHNTVVGITQVRATYKQIFAQSQSVTNHSEVKDVRLQGNEAIVLVSDDVHIVAAGGPPNKPVKIHMFSMNRDTWIKQGGVWKRSYSKQLSQKMDTNLKK